MSSNSRALKWGWFAGAILAWVGFVYLAQHQSKNASVLGRWSGSFAVLLALWLLLCLLLTAFQFPRPRAWFGRNKGRCIALFAGCIGSLVIVEIGLRVADPLGFGYLGEMKRYIQMRQEDPELVYAQPKNQTLDLDGVQVRFNALGLRGPDLGAKQAQDKRVLFLGDSVVFGWGVEEQETFVERFAQEASQATGESWQGINAGVCSYNTEQQETYLVGRGMELEPDMVLLVFIDNDVLTYSDQWKRKAAQESSSLVRRLQSTLKGSHSFMLVSHAMKNGWKGISLEGAERRVQPGDPGWTSNLQALSRIQQWCRERDIPLGVFHFRWVANDWSDRLHQAAGEAIHPTPILDTAPWFSDAPLRSWVNSQTDSHPNPRAHLRTAKRMYEALVDQGHLP